MKKLYEWTAAFMVVLMVVTGTPVFAGHATDHQSVTHNEAAIDQPTTADNATSHNWSELGVAAPTCGNPTEGMTPLMTNANPATVVGGVMMGSWLPPEFSFKALKAVLTSFNLSDRAIETLVQKLTAKTKAFDQPSTQGLTCGLGHVLRTAVRTMAVQKLAASNLFGDSVTGYNVDPALFALDAYAWQIIKTFCKPPTGGGPSEGFRKYTEAREKGRNPDLFRTPSGEEVIAFCRNNGSNPMCENVSLPAYDRVHMPNPHPLGQPNAIHKALQSAADSAVNAANRNPEVAKVVIGAAAAAAAFHFFFSPGEPPPVPITP